MLEVLNKIYASSYDISELNPIEDNEYPVFSLKKEGNPVKFCIVKDNVEFIVKLPEYMLTFFNQKSYFWMIPLETVNGKVYSYILRGYQAQRGKGQVYHTCKNINNMPPLFGFYDFRDFIKNKPVIVTEGVKDALVIKQFYKHTIALTTAGLNSSTLSILNKFTNRIILMYDSDNSGTQAQKRDIDYLTSKHIGVSVLKPKSVKDFGAYMNNPLHSADLEKEINRAVSVLSF